MAAKKKAKSAKKGEKKSTRSSKKWSLFSYWSWRLNEVTKEPLLFFL